jgi:ankyrin repeat protein
MENFSLHEEFIRACSSGDVHLMENLLNVDPSFLETPDKKYGWTGLYRTVMSGNTLASEFLVSKGAKCDVKDLKGYTLLFQAVNNLQLREVQILVQHLSDLNTIQPGK